MRIDVSLCPTMLARQAFLRDIVAQPERHDLRLIYADWLEEHGGDLDRIAADAIRAECAAAELHGGPMPYHGRLIWVE